MTSDFPEAEGPIVYPIACTIPIEETIAELTGFESDTNSGMDALTEFAGRVCYQSWSRPNPATATNRGYLANILDHEHYNLLRHSSVTFYIANVSRSMTHQMVTHTHLETSQLSQRFVNSSEAGFVVPPADRESYRSNVDGAVRRGYQTAWFDSARRYLNTVEELTGDGLSRKEVREAARAFLPNMTETKLVATANLDGWRSFIAKRHTPHADAEIREVAGAILLHLKRLAPNCFQDFPLEVDND